MAFSQTIQSSTTSTGYVWRNVRIVGGGYITGYVFSPVQQGLIYTRTDIGGAYCWNSSINQWIPLTDWIGWTDSNMIGIESIAADPIDSTRVYLACGTYTSWWAGTGVFLRSTDQGNTWLRSSVSFKMGSNELGNSMGERLAVDPKKNNILYFGSRSNGLWRSYDYASTWSKVTSFPSSYPCNVVFDFWSGTLGVSACSTIYVSLAISSVSTLYVSNDTGATWQPVSGQPMQGFMPHHMVLDADGTLYLSYANYPGNITASDGAVWKYNTNTGTWTNITPLTPSGFGYGGLSVFTTKPGTVIVATLDRWWPNDEIYVTTNGGTSWKGIYSKSIMDSSLAPYVNYGSSSASFGWMIDQLQVDPFDLNHVLYDSMWVTQQFSAATSNQYIHWTVGALGIEQTATLDLISPPSGAHLLSGMGDVCGFRHDDLTVSPPQGMYLNPRWGNTDTLDFSENNPSFICRVGNDTSQGGAYSVDGGSTWTPFSAQTQTGYADGMIAVSTDGKTVVWTPENGSAYYSRDTGASWTACSGIPSGAQAISDRVNSSKFYTFDVSAGSIYLSTDSGASFSVRATGLPTGYSQSHNLRSTPGFEGHLWLATGSNGLYRSIDLGTSFLKVTSVKECYAFGFGKASTGLTYPAIYLSGKINNTYGYYRSDDIGTTWVRMNDDQHQWGASNGIIIGDPRVYGRVYLGAEGRGILVADPVSGGADYLENWQMMY